MVHLLPHWTHPRMQPGVEVPVAVYTNCYAAELQINGRSLGTKEKADQKQLIWLVPYEPGTVTAIAYDEQMNPLCQKSVRTAGEPDTIVLSTQDAQAGRHMQVDFSICDEYGTLCPRADATVHARAFGCTLVGSENGDCLDLTPLDSPVRRAFNGLGQFTLQLDEKGGVQPGLLCAAILVQSPFLQRARVTIQVAAFQNAPGNCEIFFTTDGSEPAEESPRYAGPFYVETDTLVRALVKQGDQTLFMLEQAIVQGEREKVIDLAHGNRDVQTDHPVGPFSAKLSAYRWTDGSFGYVFNPDGTFARVLGENQSQQLGYWWYDFPVDEFEAKQYAGQGEIWYASGEKTTMRLESQDGLRLLIENQTRGFSTAYGFSKMIVLDREL